MIFFYQEIINPTMGSKVERWQKCPKAITLSNVNEDVDISKVGESDMPF
jgi:hypothetical protein